MRDDDAVIDTAMDVARRLAAGSTTALRWNQVHDEQLAPLGGPTFDASVAFEMLAFTGPDVAEGVAAIEAKRRPEFAPGSPEC